MTWRQGRKVPHHIYRQNGAEPDNRPWPEGDEPIGVFFTPEDAQLAVDAVNQQVSSGPAVPEP